MATDSTMSLTPVNVPVSQRIRERLVSSKTRFHANDNIAAYIEPGELDALLEAAMERLARAEGLPLPPAQQS